MGKMSEIDYLLSDYKESLYNFGYDHGLVRDLKEMLLSYKSDMVNDIVRGIEHDFDTLVNEVSEY